jgi:hypothetical protein
MFNVYQKRIIDSIIKPLTRNRPSSDTVYKGTVNISYVNGISKKLSCIENCFTLRTIFKTKHTLHGTLMKIGSV